MTRWTVVQPGPGHERDSWYRRGSFLKNGQASLGGGFPVSSDDWRRLFWPPSPSLSSPASSYLGCLLRDARLRPLDTVELRVLSWSGDVALLLPLLPLWEHASLPPWARTASWRDVVVVRLLV